MTAAPYADYLPRVYAGLLGKLIGVSLGRPFEGWSFERIKTELGQIEYFVNDRFGLPVVLTDDDISGTLTFLRALADHGYDPNLASEHVGETWLNYVVEGRTVFWWGGRGNSTEHTAYLNLAAGMAAPKSGAIATNGPIVAQQIGAQIFVDGWGMVAPGDPELAARLARSAASVSHDGEAVHAAQLIAAMEAAAFGEPDLDALLDCGARCIPADSLIQRVVGDVREWHAEDGDWRRTRERIAREYGPDRYPGVSHVVPNHALVILSLLYGESSFQRSLGIACTSGWDTDCNAGNVGCLLGIKGGLEAIDAGPDWRGPISDRIYLPTADGGGAITDAVRESIFIVNSGRALAGEEALVPKGGARFHFDLPGALQGFRSESPDLVVKNVEGRSTVGRRSLALRYHLNTEIAARVSTPTFIPSDALDMPGYTLAASPTLYSGQDLRAELSADEKNADSVLCRAFVRVYGPWDRMELYEGPDYSLAPGERIAMQWSVPDTHGAPIESAGFALSAEQQTKGTAYVDWLTWDGPPSVLLDRPEGGGELWRRAWVDAVDQWDPRWPEPYRLIQNRGLGMISQGTRDWTDYRACVSMAPVLAESFGLAVRVQGLTRYYALLLERSHRVRLVKMFHREETLAHASFSWQFGRTYDLELTVTGRYLRASIGGELLLEAEDGALTGGGVALLCCEGCASCGGVRVEGVKA